MTLAETRGETLYGRPVSPAKQRQWFNEGAVPIAVYGLGKMGLPLAAVYGDVTGNVTGVDIDQAVVDQINRGECPIENEPRLPYLLSELVSTGSLSATTDARAAAATASVHVIIVPTTLDAANHPDLSALKTAVEEIGSGLSEGDIVIVESTVPPGTCRGLVQDRLEEVSGLSIGDFGVAFCPERTASGRAIRDIRGAYPKVVGGIDAESTRIAELIYGELTTNRVISVRDITTAECVKVFEGVYRDVNIALANELARFARDLDIDAREAIEVANTQPYCDIHDPGPGVGGHCIPYYPYFLIDEFDTDTPLLRTARRVNESMPEYTASTLLDAFARRGIDPGTATVAVLGVTYRPDVQETRASPAFPIIDELAAAGVTVIAVDPVIEDLHRLVPRATTIDQLTDIDIDGVILVTPHSEFDRIDWPAHDELVIIDGRDALDLTDTQHAVKTIGRS